LKITTRQLRRIIKEEAAKLNESDMGVGMDRAFLDAMSMAANDLYADLRDEVDPFEIEEALVRLADQAKPGTALHRMLGDVAQGEDY
jgi:hypothetical protein